jgi:hypothetical protein
LLQKPIRLPCSLDTFYDLFLKNEANASFDHYQRDFIQDRDVLITPWISDSPTEIQPDEITVYSRILTFTHPIKSTMGMGPSEAKTKRKQILRRYQQYGMTLENNTSVEGIPAADTFSVHDFWRIEADGTDSISISANFAPRFTKRTIFKNLIEKSVLKETKVWFAGYLAMIFQALKKTKGSIPSANADGSRDKPARTEKSEIFFHRKFLQSLYWLVLFNVSLMIVLVFFIFQINGALHGIRDEIVLLRSSNSLMLLESLERGYHQCQK